MGDRWVFLGISCFLLLAGLLGCSPTPSGGRSEPDPVVEELKALDAVASGVEESASSGGEELLTLGEALEQELTSEDLGVLLSNYLAWLEATSGHASWAPDAEFYALVERLRGLPLMGGMPERSVDGKSTGTGELRWREGALVLSNVRPRCGLSCDGQALLYAMADLGLSQIERYYTDLLTSGVDCLQDAAKMGKCAALGTCTWDEWGLFVGGCAAFLTNAALEFSGASKARAAYALTKLVTGLWSAGSLGVQAQQWKDDCQVHQATECGQVPCPADQVVCHAVNGTASSCCPPGSCTGCATCDAWCGEECCTLGQTCVEGACVACARGCGEGCCTGETWCLDPEAVACDACESPCGDVCCPEGTTCAGSSGECCEVECNGQCCDADEACVGTPGSCCASPCGDRCCGAGEVCDPSTERCVRPAGCDDGPTLDCPTLCNESVAEAERRCAAMGGVLENVDLAGCVAGCQCIFEALPNFSACLLDPSCPGCEDAEAVVDGCQQAQAVCRIEE